MHGQNHIKFASITYFQRKIQLSGFSAYLGGSPSQLIRISGVLVYCIKKEALSQVDISVTSTVKM